MREAREGEEKRGSCSFLSREQPRDSLHLLQTAATGNSWEERLEEEDEGVGGHQHPNLPVSRCCRCWRVSIDDSPSFEMHLPLTTAVAGKEESGRGSQTFRETFPRSICRRLLQRENQHH